MYRVHEEISCQGKRLEELLESQFVRNAVSNSDLCASLGLDLRLGSTGAPYPLRHRSSQLIQNEPSRYVITMLSAETTSALCNMIAIQQKRVVLNITYESLHESNETVNVGQTDIPVILVDQPSTCSLDSTIPSSVPYEIPSVVPNSRDSETISSNPQIKPTKTLTAEENLSAVAFAKPSLPSNISEQVQQNSTSDNVTSHSTSSGTKTTNEGKLLYSINIFILIGVIFYKINHIFMSES